MENAASSEAASATQLRDLRIAHINNLSLLSTYNKKSSENLK